MDVVLLHRRLTILDAPGGSQPMCISSKVDAAALPIGRVPPVEADDLLAVAFNGCIYNHRELRAELSTSGHRFRTHHSDTEAILHAYRAWGNNCWARLDGMFAIALWDRRRARLILARDTTGEKPLYTIPLRELGGVAFASTVPALLDLLKSLRRPPPGPDPQLALTWLRFGAAHDPPLHEVRAVYPANTASPSPEGLSWEQQRYWSPPPRAAAPSLTIDDIDRRLADSVRQRVDADVPLGAFLSGGVDSSLIVAHACRFRPGLETFCVRMPDQQFDESGAARTIARRLGTRHTTVECPATVAQDLEDLIGRLGLPFGDSSLLPTAWVCRAARARITVALTGDGGDELFLGYERYRAAEWIRRWRPLIAAAPRVRSASPRSAKSKLARLSWAARGAGYSDLLAIFPTEQLHRILPSLSEAPAFWRGDDPARADFDEYLPADLLRKLDTASMAVALEARSPFLARSLVEAGLSSPASWLAPRGRPKGLLRMLALRHLPRDITERPKSGFAVPLAAWFRSNYGGLQEHLRDTLNSAEPFPTAVFGLEIDLRAAKSMLQEHIEGRQDHSQRLYFLLALGIYCRNLHKLHRA